MSTFLYTLMNTYSEHKNMANIRINDADKEILNEICQNRQISQSEAFGLAIRLLHKDELERQIRAFYDAVDQDPASLESHKHQIKILDSATSDGFISLDKSKKSKKSQKSRSKK